MILENVEIRLKAHNHKSTPGNQFCSKCRKTIGEGNFFKTPLTNIFSTGRLPVCKSCLEIEFDPTNEDTFLHILKSVDVPYIPSAWQDTIKKNLDRPYTVLGKYISRMAMAQFNKKKWKDSERIVAEEKAALLSAFMADSENTEMDAQEMVNEAMSLNNVGLELKKTNDIPQIEYEDASKFDKDILHKLRLRWGDGYTDLDYEMMERDFATQISSYPNVTRDPAAFKYLIMGIKLNLKTNQALDVNDFESASKLYGQFDKNNKSSNLQPVQKTEHQNGQMTVGQFFYYLELNGGEIPSHEEENYKPDIVDRQLADIKTSMFKLYAGESHIDDLVEHFKESDLFAELEENGDEDVNEEELLKEMANAESTTTKKSNGVRKEAYD